MNKFDKKIHIFFPFESGPSGGGNQFLLTLRDEFRQKNVYVETVEDADIILWNSYHYLTQVLWLKRKFPKKIFVHRLGPIFSLHRGKSWEFMDRLILEVNEKVADFTIFQSTWSLFESQKRGFTSDLYAVIGNAADPKYFYPAKEKEKGKKIRVMISGWSTNPKKGFDVYRYLDEHLDTARYECIFVGRSPDIYKKIQMKEPLGKEELGNELRRADIYVSAVEDDACSNAIVEALACGIPVVARDSGGNRELVGQRGILFSSNKDLIVCLTQMSRFVAKEKTCMEISLVADNYLHTVKIKTNFLYPRLSWILKIWILIVFFLFFDHVKRKINEII